MNIELVLIVLLAALVGVTAVNVFVPPIVDKLFEMYEESKNK